MTILWALAILIIFLCGIGVVICMAIFAERVDEIIRGGRDNENIDIK